MKAPSWPAVRDGILFFAGLAGLFYETVVRRPPDYGLLPVFAAMCGLPAFFSRRDDDDEPPPEPPALETSNGHKRSR